jgi:hypothetical protein
VECARTIIKNFMNEKKAGEAKGGTQPRTGILGYFRRLFGWRMIRRYLFCLACLVTLVALLYAEEDWRGKHAWDNFKSEWEAKGEKFDLKDFVPPPVPDDQNFAMTPFLAPMFDFNPKPLQPGQTLWRDTNGYNRIQNFSQELFSNDPKTAGRRWPIYAKSDFKIWTEALQTNSPPSETQFTTRTEAAAELLKDFEKYQPVLDELQTASQRPYCRFNIGYVDLNPAAILLPHLAIMKRFSQMFALRASAELILGQNEQALADTKMVLYLAGTMKNEPFLISGLVRIAILAIDERQIQAGLAAHAWSDAQLAELETQLGKIDLLAEYGQQMRGERAYGNGIIDFLHKTRRLDEFIENSRSAFNLMPEGWLYQNQLVINRIHQEYLLPPVDAANHRVDVAKCSEITGARNRELTSGFPPYKLLARILMPSFEGVIRKYAFAQVNVDEATLACALERYRLANGKYPDTLDALVPQFIQAVPHDLINSDPLHYRPAEDGGRFVLYSVGWNGTDDGGITVMTKGTTPHLDQTQGDWVWGAY